MEVRSKHYGRARTYISKAKLKHVNFLQRIICCNHCERQMRIQNVQHKDGSRWSYYQEASRARGLDCIYSPKIVRMKNAESQVFAFISNISLPENWHKEIERLMDDMDTVRQIENRRVQIADELRRLGRTFADGAFSESEYESRRSKLLAEKESLVVPDGARVIEVGLRLESLGDFLGEATDEEKYQILHLLLEYVYFDFSQKKIVRFKPKAEFIHLFRLAAPLAGWTESTGNIFYLA